MPSFDFKRLNRTMMIYRVVQTILLAILLFIAINFQSLFAQMGKPVQFIYCLGFSVVIQLILIYPVYRLALRDAGVETDASQTGLTSEQLAALRKKRMLGDLWKFSGVGFFLAFVTIMPDVKKASGAPFFLATTIFSFLLTCIMYFQCFNFSAKKKIKENGS